MAGDVGDRSPRFFRGRGKTRGIRPQKGMPLPEERICVLACVPRPQTGIGKALFSSPGGVRNATRVRPRQGGGANEIVVPTCRGDFLQVVSGMCRMSFGLLPGRRLPFCRPRRRRAGGRNAASGSGRERSAASPARKKCLPAVKDAAAGEGCLCGRACAVVAEQRQWRR